MRNFFLGGRSERASRKHRKTMYPLAALAISLVAQPLAHVRGGNVAWTSSTREAPWVAKPDFATTDHAGAALNIQIDPARTFQKIDGFGGCFNELGWSALNTLNVADRAAVLKALFDPVDGCKFNLCRMPIGASDYAHDYYSLDDNPGDLTMSKFNLVRDRRELIPYIKAAMAFRPDLRVWGSPWTPPAWMKDNQRYNGGQLTWTPENLKAYALYFEKVVQSYQAEGIRLYAVHVQNEPGSAQIFPSCVWKPEQFQTFIRDYLGPTFKVDKVPAEIWVGTINVGPQADFAGVVCGDKEASAYVTGIGYQWAGKAAIAGACRTFPDKKFMQTETECGNGDNSWGYAETTWALMKHYLGNGANAYMQWNMVLDGSGNSTWGWKQNAMVTVDTAGKTFALNPQFYCAKHFSYHVKPGAVRVFTEGSYGDKIAFQNPDGEIVLEVMNHSGGDLDCAVGVTNSDGFMAHLPAHSINTFRFKP